MVAYAYRVESEYRVMAPLSFVTEIEAHEYAALQWPGQRYRVIMLPGWAGFAEATWHEPRTRLP